MFIFINIRGTSVVDASLEYNYQASIAQSLENVYIYKQV